MATGMPIGGIWEGWLAPAFNVIDYDFEPQPAVDAPRIHFQAQPDTVFVEAGALTKEARKQLEAQGYHFEEQKPWCAVELIQVDGDRSRGANDYRRPAGSAAGY